MPEQSQYAAAARVPLIKSPSLRVPQPVTLPPDIHPLPDCVTAYFVYPFTIEPHILTLESSRRNTFCAQAARLEAYLRTRQEEKNRRKRDALRRIAPGFEPEGSTLVPTRTSLDTVAPSSELLFSGDSQSSHGHGRTRSTVDDLAEQLTKLNPDSSSGLSKAH